jgi:hypothetical protein
MYGYSDPDDPIGPEPSRQTPDQRAVWHQAFAALSSPTGPDVRTMPDDRLWLLRDTYAAETAWAPRHAGKELRLARLGALNTGLGAIRAAADAELRRRHAAQKIESLRSAEPVSLTDNEHHDKLPETGTWIYDLAAQHHAFREKLNERQNLLPDDDLDWSAFSGSAPRRGAILQPPKPEIIPSATILQLAAEHDIEPEAAG